MHISDPFGGIVLNDRETDELIFGLREQLRHRDREIDDLRVSVDDAQQTGIAVGVLLARTPGWTEQEAWAAWDRACAQLTRGGNVKALVSYVVQTGNLPGEGVAAQV